MIHMNEKKNEIIYHILRNTFSLLHSKEILNKSSHTHTKISRILKANIAAHEEVPHNKTIDDSRLDNVLLSFGFKKWEVPSDGHCIFTSIVFFLEKVFKLNNENELISHLQSIGITSDNYDVLLLRALMVDEWLLNHQDYQSFFIDALLDFEAEAENYRGNGVFASCLGDAMLLGLSNVLHLQIIVFTSIPSWPHFTIYPRCPPASQNPLYLAYIHGSSGHYYLAIKQVEASAQPTVTDNDIEKASELTDNKNMNTLSCRCGRGRNSTNSERVNCCENKSYSSRCPCLKKWRNTIK